MLKVSFYCSPNKLGLTVIIDVEACGCNREEKTVLKEIEASIRSQSNLKSIMAHYPEERITLNIIQVILSSGIVTLSPFGRGIDSVQEILSHSGAIFATVKEFDPKEVIQLLS